MQTLFYQTKQLIEENEELQAQMSVAGPSQSRHTQSQQTTSRQIVETSYPEGTKFSYGSYSRQSKEESSSDRQMQLDEGINSTRV